MKNKFYLLTILFLLKFSSILQAQVSGFVFRDINGNGQKDNTASFNEPFAFGVTVKAYNNLNLQIGTSKTTDINGAFSFSNLEIPASTKVRIEFASANVKEYSSFMGVDNGSDVQFVTAPSTTVRYAILSADDYYNNVLQPDPDLLIVNLRRGTTNSQYSGRYSILHLINNSASYGPYYPSNNVDIVVDTTKRPAIHNQTGSLFGLASQKKQQRLFASALLKRASGFGSKGTGGVYIMDKSGSNWNLSGSFTLQGVTPSNGGTALDFGAVTRVTSPNTDDNFISDNGIWNLGDGSDSRDINAFAKATTISFGDIESDHTNNNIFMINLNQKKLIVFDASATTLTLNNATPSTLAPFTKAYDISTLPGCPAPTGIGNNIRPFAVKIFRGKGYLGVVSDAMNTQSKSDLIGYILQFDPENINAGFTTVVTINFSNYQANYWNPWVTTWGQTGGNSTSGPREYPQPIISSIEFNEDGSMDIGIRDRWGDQGGAFERIPVSGSNTGMQTSITGELLHACWIGTGWALEGTPGSCDQPAANINDYSGNSSFGFGYSYGNTGKEWYADRSGDGTNENSQGGLTKLMGSGTITSTIYDPIGTGETTGSSYWSTQGLQWNTVATGVKKNITRLIGEGTQSLDKSNGMGDVEYLLAPAPIQIGNRIWLDANANGIQDADETAAGVPTGTTVTLRSPGVDGTYITADDQVTTTTTDANGNYMFSALASADNRKPSNWVGIGNTILPGYAYRIEVALPLSFSVGPLNISSNLFDNIDNDATVNGLNAVVDIIPTNTMGNVDIGLADNLILASKYLNLKVTKQNNTSVLNFSIAQQATGSIFSIERSVTGTNFTAIGTVVATTASNYNYTDFAPVQNEKNYYRIKEMDARGNISYSEVKMVKYTNDIKVEVYPIPAVSNINVTLNDVLINKAITITLYNAQGQIVLYKQIINASATESFNVSNIASGTYQLQIKNNNEIVAKTKVIIVK